MLGTWDPSFPHGCILLHLFMDEERPAGLAVFISYFNNLVSYFAKDRSWTVSSGQHNRDQLCSTVFIIHNLVVERSSNELWPCCGAN